MNDLPSPPKVRREIQLSPLVRFQQQSQRQPPEVMMPNRTQFIPIISPRQIQVSSHSTGSFVPSVNNQGSLKTSNGGQWGPQNTPLGQEQLTAVKTEPAFAIEGEMVDFAIDNVMNLPQAFNEVVESQKNQTHEIQRQQNLLKSIKEKVKQVLEKKEDLAQEVTSVTHKIYIINEKHRQCTKKCKDYDLEIKQLVAETEGVRNHAKDLEEEREMNKKLYQKYQNIVSQHTEDVAKFEDELEVHKELRRMKSEIALLQGKLDMSDQSVADLLSGTLEKEQNEAIVKAKQENNQLRVNIQDLRNQIGQERERQGQIQVSLNVLQKKNLAQLTRLKKQVKVAQQSSRQWNDQISQLQKSIMEVQCKLGQ